MLLFLCLLVHMFILIDIFGVNDLQGYIVITAFDSDNKSRPDISWILTYRVSGVGKAIGRVRLSVRSSVCFRSNFRTSLLSNVKDQLFQKSGNRRTRSIALHFHAGGNKNYQKSNTLKLRVKFSEGVREPVPTIRHRLCGLIPGTPVPSNRDPIRSIEHPCVVESPKKNQQYAIPTRYVKGRRRERKEKGRR